MSDANALVATVAPQPPQRRSVLYDKGISDTLAREIRNNPNNSVQVVAAPYRTLKKSVFSKLKTPIDELDRINVVYEFPCDGKKDEQCGLSYVGQTKNPLRARLTQHKNDITHGRNPKGQSAVVTHFTEAGHFPAFDKAKVLATASNFLKRNTLESMHIYSRDTYNLRRDTEGIAASYCALLDSCRTDRLSRTQRNNNTHTHTVTQHGRTR